MLKFIATEFALVFILAGECCAQKTVAVDSTAKVIHVFVALCDNKYQGIVPVPKGIGNGQDPANNLYWGCGYGVSTYFKKSGEWQFLSSQKIDSMRMERIVFKHRLGKNLYLVADAYNGRHIKECTKDFLASSCGLRKESCTADNRKLPIDGSAVLLAYIGHDGLMDFELYDEYVNTDGKKRDLIILACSSRTFFAPHLKRANVTPMVWTTGLMCPEAYTLHDALSAWVTGGTNEAVRTKAAQAYSRYQKCSEKAARNLLVTGW